MELPDEVGIMTLPNAILFPQALLPLYIFEPRYRTMLKESLENQRMFAIALPHATSDPSPNRVGGVGLIRACVDKPDGSSNLILQGVSRVRFTDFVQEKPYYVGRIEILTTEESHALEDIVTYSFIEDGPRKQDILETLNLRARLQKVIVALRKQASGPKLG